MKHTLFVIAVLTMNVLIPLHGQTNGVKETDSINFYLGYLYGKRISHSLFEWFNADAFIEGVKSSVDAADINEEKANRYLQHHLAPFQQKMSDTYPVTEPNFLK
ncbi:MAG: hypothetical protein LBS03_02765 [Bacteroidales bacterium]|jgi:hypothetical protein|nr:hypothetical protein [Bacteroidales bacterium]